MPFHETQIILPVLILILYFAFKLQTMNTTELPGTIKVIF